MYGWSDDKAKAWVEKHKGKCVIQSDLSHIIHYPVTIVSYGKCSILDIQGFLDKKGDFYYIGKGFGFNNQYAWSIYYNWEEQLETL